MNIWHMQLIQLNKIAVTTLLQLLLTHQSQLLLTHQSVNHVYINLLKAHSKVWDNFWLLKAL